MRKLFLIALIVAFVPAMAYAGTYTLYYDWGCTGNYGYTVVTTYPDGTFLTTGGYGGTWGYQTGVAYFQYDSGCCPLYVFCLRGQRKGYMKCSDGSEICDPEQNCCYVLTGGDAIIEPRVGELDEVGQVVTKE